MYICDIKVFLHVLSQDVVKVCTLSHSEINIGIKKKNCRLLLFIP